VEEKLKGRETGPISRKNPKIMKERRKRKIGQEGLFFHPEIASNPKRKLKRKGRLQERTPGGRRGSSPTSGKKERTVSLGSILEVWPC